MPRGSAPPRPINYTDVDLKAWLKEHTGGKGVDVVYDPVGGASSEPALRSMAWKGRFLVIGFAAGDIPRVPLNLPLLKGCSIIGVFYGEHGTRSPHEQRELVDELIGMLAEGRINPSVTAQFTLDAVRRRAPRADGPQGRRQGRRPAARADLAPRRLVARSCRAAAARPSACGPPLDLTIHARCGRGPKRSLT